MLLPYGSRPCCYKMLPFYSLDYTLLNRGCQSCFLLPHSEYPPVGGMGVRGLSPASAQNVHLRYACAVAACGQHRPRPQWGRISKEKLPHCSCCRLFSLVLMYPPSFGCHVLTPLFDETAQKTEAGCQYMTPCPWPSVKINGRVYTQNALLYPLLKSSFF